MPRHVRRVARRAVGESVGLIVDGFFEELVGRPFVLRASFLSTSSANCLKVVSSFSSALYGLSSSCLARSRSRSCVAAVSGLEGATEEGTDFSDFFDFSDERVLFEDVELSSDGSLGLPSATDLGLVGL